MIITRTPYRVSLFGGGTDYPAWYQDHGGSVIGMAINKYCYISVRRLPPFFEHRHRIVYSKIETVRKIEDIEHPAVRAVLMDMQIREGLEIHYDGDLPARSGIGSSSTFTVGLLHALYALRGRMITKRELASEAIRIEQKVLLENVGSQDQVWAAFGGLNRLTFNRDCTFSVTPIVVTASRRQQLVDHMMLFFTGISRIASDVAKNKIASILSGKADLSELRDIVDEAQQILIHSGRDLCELGRLLHESWIIKRKIASGISNDHIDSIYEVARGCGAWGGKLLGAGAGGFMMLLVPPEHRPHVREGLKNLIEVDLGIDNDGSTVVVYQPADSSWPG
jgi:D-glycero-alpha-D-manno-heptose-7-phosphate kinase